MSWSEQWDSQEPDTPQQKAYFDALIEDAEADEAIDEATSFAEAMWSLAEKYHIPLTNNEPRLQDGRWLRQIGDFIRDAEDIARRFPAEPQAEFGVWSLIPNCTCDKCHADRARSYRMDKKPNE